MFLFATLAYAQDVAPAAPDPSKQFMFIAIFLGIMVFFFILPQRKKQKEHEKKLASLKEKDKVVTVGGLLGTIMKVKGNIVELKVTDNVKVEVLKTGISSILNDEK